MAVVIPPPTHYAATTTSHTPPSITASNSPCASPEMSPHSLSPQLTKSTFHAHTHSNMSSCSTTTTTSGINSIATTTSHTPIRSREVSLSTSQTSSVLPESDKTSTTSSISPQFMALAQQPVVSHSTHLRKLTHIPPFLISSYIHSQTIHDHQYDELQTYLKERTLLEQELNQLRDAIPVHMTCQAIMNHCKVEDPFEEMKRLEEEEKRMQKSCGGCNIM